MNGTYAYLYASGDFFVAFTSDINQASLFSLNGGTLTSPSPNDGTTLIAATGHDDSTPNTIQLRSAADIATYPASGLVTCGENANGEIDCSEGTNLHMFTCSGVYDTLWEGATLAQADAYLDSDCEWVTFMVVDSTGTAVALCPLS